uniref:Uncharacterized protein n=1 Tax=Romanomermis culicivorax TaxID=13658 RepID=A0A915HXX7_ROMCU
MIQLISRALILCVVISTMTSALELEDEDAVKTYCAPDEEARNPCTCCKMRCWYDTHQDMVKKLGTAATEDWGEHEVLKTLNRMKQCTRFMCQPICKLVKKSQITDQQQHQPDFDVPRNLLFPLSNLPKSQLSSISLKKNRNRYD